MQHPPSPTLVPVVRILFNEPDFIEGESLLEMDARANGFEVLFLPKFHCELNPIEQCWGYAKRNYRLLPPSSKEDVLEANVIACLDGIPVETIQRFATRSLRFMDAYRKGLNGKQAAWAAKRYRGHRVIPPNLMSDLDKAGLA